MQDTEKEGDKMKNTIKRPVDIPVSKLRPFEGHPFKVKDDAEMNTLIESIELLQFVRTAQKAPM